MANTQQFYSAGASHCFFLDSNATAGVTSPAFTRNFRVLDVTVFVTTAAVGGTLTLTRTRSGATTTLCAFDVSAAGRATITLDIDQSVALFQSGDTLTLTTSSATSVLNCFVSLVQFSA